MSARAKLSTFQIHALNYTSYKSLVHISLRVAVTYSHRLQSTYLLLLVRSPHGWRIIILCPSYVSMDDSSPFELNRAKQALRDIWCFPAIPFVLFLWIASLLLSLGLSASQVWNRSEAPPRDQTIVRHDWQMVQSLEFPVHLRLKH